jgi:hypothetical protein
MGFLRNAACAAALATVGLPLSASAADEPSGGADLATMTMGYTYYNRPGADPKSHDAEVADCAAEAARTISYDEQIHNGASQGLMGALIGGALQHAYHRGAAAAGLENCMVVRGWRVVKLDDAEGAELGKLAPADLAARLAPWIGAENPHGQVARTFHNDAANAASTRYAIRPGHDDTQLSLTAATGGRLTQFNSDNRPADSTRDVLDAKWPRKALTPQTLSSAPQGGAILLIQIKGLSGRNGVGVTLNRMGAEADIAPSRSDHAPDVLVAAKGTLFARKEGDLFAFAVPPGRWRVAGLISGGPALNFCLGAPAFEVKAGEVVYAGSFDLSAADIGPDLDLAPAKAWLAGAPQADRLRAAAYFNGTRGACGNNAIYALEVKGAPFEPGYVWGGAVAAATAQVPAAP